MSEITAAKQHHVVKPLHVVLYARVALHEAGALDRQVASLRQVAGEQGWTEVQVIAESRPWGISAQALATVCSADIVLVTGEDRLGRRLTQLVEVREALVTHGVRVATPGRVETEAQARFQLAVLRTLPDVGQAGKRLGPSARTLPGCPRAVDAGDIAAPSAQDVLVHRMLDVLREHERTEHARRTRAGIAAAKARREAQR